MHITNPKKMNTILILEVLKKHSDENNKLSQKEIGILVEREYGVPFDRHTLKRNLDNLLSFHCGVEYTKRDKETNETGGWYFERDITDAEMRMLIDGLLFSKYIPYSECKGLIKKLEALASVDFKSDNTLPENRPENKEIFLNIEELLLAMSTNKKVGFNYIRYGMENERGKNPAIVTDNDGSPRTYTVSPYEIVITNGYYYLICNNESSDKLYHYRLNAICNVKVLKSKKRRPIRDIPGYSNGLDLAVYMKEHPYMMASGEVVRVKLRFEKWLLGHIYEWFGKDIPLLDETDETVTTIINVNEKAMLFWALQYGLHVEVLEPQSLREKIKDAVLDIGNKYR